MPLQTPKGWEICFFKSGVKSWSIGQQLQVFGILTLRSSWNPQLAFGKVKIDFKTELDSLQKLKSCSILQTSCSFKVRLILSQSIAIFGTFQKTEFKFVFAQTRLNFQCPAFQMNDWFSKSHFHSQMFVNYFWLIQAWISKHKMELGKCHSWAAMNAGFCTKHWLHFSGICNDWFF